MSDSVPAWDHRIFIRPRGGGVLRCQENGLVVSVIEDRPSLFVCAHVHRTSNIQLLHYAPPPFQSRHSRSSRMLFKQFVMAVPLLAIASASPAGQPSKFTARLLGRSTDQRPRLLRSLRGLSSRKTRTTCGFGRSVKLPNWKRIPMTCGCGDAARKRPSSVLSSQKTPMVCGCGRSARPTRRTRRASWSRTLTTSGCGRVITPGGYAAVSLVGDSVFGSDGTTWLAVTMTGESAQVKHVL